MRTWAMSVIGLALSLTLFEWAWHRWVEKKNKKED